MIIKSGNIVSHEGALEWGAGKVLAVTASMATIHFSDGKNRKIASSHFTTLHPAAASAYIPLPEITAAVKVPRAPRKVKPKEKAITLP